MRLRRLAKYIAAIVIFWIILVAAGLIFSRSVQDKVISLLSEQANKYILSEIHIRKSDIHFSVIQKFPLASVELKNICVKLPSTFNVNEGKTFRGDTLLYAKKVYLQLNLLSLLGKKYELRKISVSDGFLQFLTDKKGHSSIDIIRKNPEGEKSEISTDIKALSVSGLMVYTSHYNNKVEAKLFFENGLASGTFATTDFSVKLKTNGTLLNFSAKNQKLEPNQKFLIDVAIENKNMVYTIPKGNLTISNIPLKVTGTFQPDNKMLIDMVFSAGKVPIRQIDKALLQGLLGENGIELKGGNLDLKGSLMGYAHHTLPAIKVNYKITNGKIFEARHNLLLENIYLVGNADNGKEHLPKSTTIRVDTFSLRLGKSEQHGKLKMQNLIDPQLAVYSSGKVFYSDVKDFISPKEVIIKDGEFNNQIAFAAIIDKNSRNKILNDISLRAKITITKLDVEFPKLKMPPASITGKLEITENNLMRLDKLQFVSGKTDITLSGTLSGYLDEKPYLNYKGSIISEKFQADEFFGIGTSTGEPSTPLEFPDSIRVSGNFTVKNFVYGKFETHMAKGAIEYDNKIASITDFSMTGFDGNMSGIAKVGQDRKGEINLFTVSNLSKVDVKKLFIACNNFNQDFIGHQHLDGNISGKVNLSISWTNMLEFIPSSVIAQSEVVLSKGEIKDYEPLMGLSKFIKVEELKDIKFENLYANITINKEQVYLEQTRVVSSALSFDCAGVHGFDNKYEYRLQLALSDFLWKKTKSKNTEITEFGYVVDENTEQTIIPVIIIGNGTEFDVKYDKKTARNRFKDKIDQEKLELKTLFSTSQLQENQTETNTGNEETTPVKLEKLDSGKYRTQSNEYILEWDDSEDEGGGNDY